MFSVDEGNVEEDVVEESEELEEEDVVEKDTESRWPRRGIDKRTKSQYAHPYKTAEQAHPGISAEQAHPGKECHRPGGPMFEDQGSEPPENAGRDPVEEKCRRCKKDDNCPPGDTNENWFKGSKDQLLFEELVKKWVK